MDYYIINAVIINNQTNTNKYKQTLPSQSQTPQTNEKKTRH